MKLWAADHRDDFFWCCLGGEEAVGQLIHPVHINASDSDVYRRIAEQHWVYCSVELNAAIKLRIALRKLQASVLDAARVKFDFKGNWVELGALYPTLTEPVFVDAYTKIFMKCRTKAAPTVFNEQLNQRLAAIAMPREEKVIQFSFPISHFY
jgi:hypothetical protein